jgi:hypothetical protein
LKQEPKAAHSLAIAPPLLRGRKAHSHDSYRANKLSRIETATTKSLNPDALFEHAIELRQRLESEANATMLIFEAGFCRRFFAFSTRTRPTYLPGESLQLPEKDDRLQFGLKMQSNTHHKKD